MGGKAGHGATAFSSGPTFKLKLKQNLQMPRGDENLSHHDLQSCSESLIRLVPSGFQSIRAISPLCTAEGRAISQSVPGKRLMPLSGCCQAVRLVRGNHGNQIKNILFIIFLENTAFLSRSDVSRHFFTPRAT